MAWKPTRWSRLVSRLRHTVPALELEAYRRASLPVFDLYEQVEQRREACRDQGLDPWAVPQAMRTEFACGWNAFVLQVLGNCLMDADGHGQPAARGYLPSGTAEQVLVFYREVEGWMRRAHQARSNPAYTVDVPLPSALPRWSEDDHRSPAHVAGLRHAMRSLRGHVETGMAFLPDDAPDHPRKQAHLERIRQAHAAAEARAGYAEELCGAGPRPASHAFAEAYLRDAIERYYLLGQVIADPLLAEKADVATHRPVDLGAGTGRRVVKRSPRRRRRLGKRERELLATASDSRLPFVRRQDAVIEACRGRTPVADLVALYEWLEVGALREMLVFGLQSRPEVEAVEMIARIARDDPDAQVRHIARFWLRSSRHRDAARLVLQLPAR